MNKTAINRDSLKEQVKRILKKKIYSGELAPGERLKIIPISESLNVSQAPVREAIQCLVTGGLLEHIPNVGVRVREFSEEEVRETYHVRKILEMASIRQTSTQPKMLATILKTHLKQMEIASKKKDVESYIKHNNLFHRSMVQTTGNKKMLDVWDSLRLPQFMKQAISNLKMPLEEMMPLHSAIIDALNEGSVEKAATALEKHYNALN